MEKAWKKSDRLTAVLQPCEGLLPVQYHTWFVQSLDPDLSHTCWACLHQIPGFKSDGWFCSGSYSRQLFVCLQKGYGSMSPTSCRTELSYILSLGIFPRQEYWLSLKGWCQRATSKDTKVNSLYSHGLSGAVWNFHALASRKFFLVKLLTTQVSQCQYVNELSLSVHCWAWSRVVFSELWARSMES